MKKSKLTEISYTRTTDIGGTKGEVTHRYIIPTTLPINNIKALDVTELPSDDMLLLERLYQEYTEYVEQQLSTMFDFNDWVQHTQNIDISSKIKWRTFSPSSTQEI